MIGVAQTNPKNPLAILNHLLYTFCCGKSRIPASVESIRCGPSGNHSYLNIRKSSSGSGAIPYRRYSPRPVAAWYICSTGYRLRDRMARDDEHAVVTADLVRFQNRQ